MGLGFSKWQKKLVFAAVSAKKIRWSLSWVFVIYLNEHKFN
jgi:hypothetical protein